MHHKNQYVKEKTPLSQNPPNSVHSLLVSNNC